MKAEFLIKIFLFTIVTTNYTSASWVKINGVPQNGELKINGLSYGTDSTGQRRAIFAGTLNGVFFSLDTCNSWSFFNGSPKNVLSLCDNLVAGTSDSGIYNKWVGYWRAVGHSQRGPIYAVAIPNNSYLIGTKPGVYLGDINLATDQNIGLSNYKINSLAITEYKSNFTTGSSSYYFFAGTDSGIFFSDYTLTSSPGPYNQASWIARNSGLSNLHINALASPFIPNINDSNIVISGSDAGIFISKNKGVNWSNFNDGLTETNVTSIIWGDVLVPYIFAATYTNNVASIWRRPLSDITSMTVSRYISFPENSIGISLNNSFLRYTLSSATSVSLRIFDLKGRLVSTINDRFQHAGYHCVPLSTKGFAIGNYVLEFIAGKYKISKTIYVVK